MEMRSRFATSSNGLSQPIANGFRPFPGVSKYPNSLPFFARVSALKIHRSADTRPPSPLFPALAFLQSLATRLALRQAFSLQLARAQPEGSSDHEPRQRYCNLK
jgi:hypothetical protein